MSLRSLTVDFFMAEHQNAGITYPKKHSTTAKHFRVDTEWVTPEADPPASSARSDAERATDVLGRSCDRPQDDRNLASDDLLRLVELESHDHAFGTWPLDTAET